jgi:S-adenosylmethionine synthetase
MGSEAAAGKNPVSHDGKIYNLLTHKIANEIYSRIPGLLEVYVWLVSQIGKPIDQPALAAARVIPEKGTKLREVEPKIREVIDLELERIDVFCRELASGKYTIC